jgi:hypothetical protein
MTRRGGPRPRPDRDRPISPHVFTAEPPAVAERPGAPWRTHHEGRDHPMERKKKNGGRATLSLAEVQALADGILVTEADEAETTVGLLAYGLTGDADNPPRGILEAAAAELHVLGACLVASTLPPGLDPGRLGLVVEGVSRRIETAIELHARLVAKRSPSDEPPSDPTTVQ